MDRASSILKDEEDRTDKVLKVTNFVGQPRRSLGHYERENANM